MGGWQTYDQYGYALLAVVGTFAAVYLIHRAMQHRPWQAALHSSALNNPPNPHEHRRAGGLRPFANSHFNFP